MTTRVELDSTSALTNVWLPLAYAGSPDFQRVIKQSWTGNAKILRAVRYERTQAGLLFARWPEGDVRPEVTLALTIATRDREVDWHDRTPRGLAAAALAPYLRPTSSMPLDKNVREAARRIAKAESDEVGKARAIYEWIVENETGSLAGKYADLNALFVALSRAVGVPARVLYGLRVGPSRTFQSLGKAGDVTRAQHCRAEFHSMRHGWIPVDPADVRTIIQEEKPGLDLASPDVQYARRRFFGAWEMNWIAFNDVHDLLLPDAAGPALPFFMYPQAEVGGRRLDSLDPAGFRYSITAREV